MLLDKRLRVFLAFPNKLSDVLGLGNVGPTRVATTASSSALLIPPVFLLRFLDALLSLVLALANLRGELLRQLELPFPHSSVVLVVGERDAGLAVARGLAGLAFRLVRQTA